MSNDNVTTSNKLSISILSILTLIATIIALVPAFLSLNDKQAVVYYSYNTSSISIPLTIDSDLAIETLEKAGIPGSTVELKIINQGNVGADEVKFEIVTPTEILATWTEPTVESVPIWVDIPKLNTHKNKLRLSSELQNLSTTKPVSVFVGFKYGNEKQASAAVFFNGQPAIYIDDVSEAHKWSKWNVFILPAYIIGAGFALILVWLFVNALINNPELRNDLQDALFVFAHIALPPLAVADLVKAIQKEKAKRDNE